jgi:hypothetical protein
MRRGSLVSAAALLGALWVLAEPVQAASRYDPALRFRTLATPHFLIYFHQREAAIAQRFATIAEQVHRELTARLRTEPASRTHVILVDQNDLSNGWATPLPYDTIEITVAPPAARNVIGNTDDWLRLAFAHEYTHILQLDWSRGFASAVRAVFGRSPISFPNLFLPTWQIEGLATYEESATTGRGRINAGDFAVFVNQAAREGRALPLDRASSDVDDWPAGNTPYAYGGFFQQYLAKRFGDEKLAELSRRTAGRFYFLSAPAFKKTFGKSLSELWKDFEQAQAGQSPTGTGDTGRRLTKQGFVVAGPRFVESAVGRPEILYSSRTADDFPALMAVDLEGRTRGVASRYYGEEITASGRAAVFDQLELVRSVALRSDLYLLDLASGGVDRLTADGRLLDPAVAPRENALACVRLRAGERHLALFDLPGGAWPHDLVRLRAALAGQPRIELAESGIEYASPRWSPDGRWIAVSRRLREGPAQIAVVDAATGALSVLVSSDPARNVTPAWTPDGRTIVFASDRKGGPFNLYALDLRVAAGDPPQAGALYQVTDLASGASYPDVSADGRQLAYVGYTTAGYDVFVLPLDRTCWQPVVAENSETRSGRMSLSMTPSTRFLSGVAGPSGQPRPEGSPGSRQVAETETRRKPESEIRPDLISLPYRPWGTLLPRYWMPALDSSDQQVKLGAETSGGDVLGRHVYTATVLYRVAGEPGAPGSRRYDWAAGYTYDRWLPTFFADASDRTHFLRDVQTRGGPIVPADLREQNGEVGLFLPDFHVRYKQGVTASLNVQRQTLNIGGLAHGQSDRNGLRLAWSLNSAKVYAYSISPEQGATMGVTGELVRRALGADAGASATTVDARSYLRLGRRHAILAVRAAFGAAWGDAGTARLFYLGGSGPNANPIDFGSDGLNLLRGFDQNEFWGRRIAVVNVEYRVPLLRVERGIGTWPVFLRALHATGFFDAGKTWSNDFSLQPFERSLGAEVAAHLRLAYALPLTTAFGVAWPHDPHGFTRQPVVYFRLGHAF